VLELICMENPARLYDRLWPKILHEKAIPQQLLDCLSTTLDEDPHFRKNFSDLYELLEAGEDAISNSEPLAEETIERMLENTGEDEDGLSVGVRAGRDDDNSRINENASGFSADNGSPV
jgi:hypothetical protein